MIDQAGIEIAEAHDMVAVFQLGQPDELAMDFATTCYTAAVVI